MIRRKSDDEFELLNKTIAAAHAVLDSTPTYSEEYAKTVDQLAKFYAMRDYPKLRVSPDTLAVVGGNVLVALIIVAYEQRSAMTSKALGFIGKAVR